jgi:hypothetical protein
VARQYYACCVRIDGADVFLAWYQDATSGFVRTASDRVLATSTLEQLGQAARELGFSLPLDEVTDYDFDRIAAWCDRPTPDGIECVPFLNAWNMLDDLARVDEIPDTPFARLSRDCGGCYDKLFWGNNIPTVTPPGERYVPSWDADEVEDTRAVMAEGLSLVRKEIAGIL